MRVEAVRYGIRRQWRVQGEQTGGRFEVPEPLDVQIVHARLTGVDLSGLRFAHFLAHDSVFDGCDFSNTAFDHPLFGSTTYGRQWDGKSWPVTVYRNCTFTRTRFPPDTYFGNARFENCLFDRARWRTQTSTDVAQFVDCTFRGKLHDFRFWGRIEPTWTDVAALGRDRNDFTGNDFTGADLVYGDFRGIDLRAQRFPGPPGYALLDRVDRRVAAALDAIAGWPDDEKARIPTTTLTRHAAEALAENDGYALVSADWIGLRVPPDVRRRVFDLLVAYSDDQQ
jgi:uncharacterized protein YjbI with pentapeptide repeats